MNTVFLWEILVPCTIDNEHIKLKHHKQWDKFVQRISGGLTILKPVKGIWVFKNESTEERMIPVRMACTEKEMLKIVNFTAEHYQQKSVMVYKLTEEVYIKRFDDE